MSQRLDEGLEGRTAPRTVTKADVVLFGGQTGDYSAMHFDHNAALARDDGRIIAHGLLGAAFSLGGLAQSVPALLGHNQRNAFLERYTVNYREPVFVGDTLHSRWRITASSDRAHVAEIEIFNQRQVVVSDAELQLNCTGAVESQSPWPLDTVDAIPVAEKDVWYLEDYSAEGQQGETIGRTLTEADVVNFAALTGDFNPLHCNAVFAKAALFGARTVHPMLCFSMAFAAWLREWTRRPMPDAQFAGHISDQWQHVAPVFIGDTIRCRYKTLAVRRSKSRPAMGLLTFGLQLINQNEQLVQQASVLMMYPAREKR